MMYLQSSELKPADSAYYVFISFLYAWIAADIGQKFGETEAQWRRAEGWFKRSHLILAAFVVGTSFLGWTGAWVAGSVSDPERKVISAPSLLVIVDFTILAIYFNFVSDVHKERKEPEKDPGKSLKAPIYYRHSAFWISLILLSYVVWDIFNYLLIPVLLNKNHTFWVKSWMSLACAAVAGTAFAWLIRVRSHRPGWVAVADFSLIALLLCFRAMKQLPYAEGSWLYWFAAANFCIFVILAAVAGACGSWKPDQLPKPK
jgi:hypothetical protein